MSNDEKGEKQTEKSDLVKASEHKSEKASQDSDLKDLNNQRLAEQFQQSNNQDSLSDMQLKALGADAPERAKLAENRFELVDDSSRTGAGLVVTAQVERDSSDTSLKKKTLDSSQPQSDGSGTSGKVAVSNQSRPSYVEGLKAVVDTAKTPEERERKQQKFEQFYALRKEAEQLAEREPAALNPSQASVKNGFENNKVDVEKRATTDGDGGTHKSIVQRKINANDTLTSIAKEQLGAGATEVDIRAYEKLIAQDNRIKDSDKLDAGTTILLRPYVHSKSEPVADAGETPFKNGMEKGLIGSADGGDQHIASKGKLILTPAPGDNFRVLGELMDKHYSVPAVFTDSSRSVETFAAIGKETNREHLLEVAKKHGLDVGKSIELIEDRIANKEVSSQEILKTYQNVERLLETESTKGVTVAEREILAQQILLQTGNPTRIDQGNHNTCNVTSVECRVYTRAPSYAARMVTDLALNGEYLAEDGNTDVKLDPRPIDASGVKVHVVDGIRSYASELFQVCAVNVHYVKEGKGTRYEQIVPRRNDDGNTGERLYDSSMALIAENPNLDDNALIEIYDAIAGDSGDRFVFCHKGYVCGSDKGLTTIASEADLLEKLRTASSSDYPLIFGVHTANEPFWTDSTGGTAGGAGGDSGGGHFVTVRQFVPGPPPTVVLDNQWGMSKDHVDKFHNLSVRELYFSMRPPNLGAVELEKTLTADRNHGRRNAWDDLELQRQRAMYKLADPKAIEMDVINVIAERLNKNSNADEWERAAGAQRLELVLSCLPEENAVRIRQEQNRVGLITDEELREHIIKYAKNIVQKREDKEKALKELLSEVSANQFSDVIIDDDLSETGSK